MGCAQVRTGLLTYARHKGALVADDSFVSLLFVPCSVPRLMG
jgi:hypothetical protein